MVNQGAQSPAKGDGMGFHDDLAASARLAGQSATQFRAAAQRHANSTWVWLLIAGGVWYFTAWWWALIPTALAVWSVVQSVSSTAIALRLERTGG
jgi:hypothetical protein